jgi:dihydroneopterin aldolase
VIAANIIPEGAVVTTATTLFVRGLRIEAEIGVHGHERRCRQILLVDVDLQIRPVRGPALTDTLDYSVVLIEAETIAASGHIVLVETFADRLGRALLYYPQVVRATVRVAKPAALTPAADVAGVEVVMIRG